MEIFWDVTTAVSANGSTDRIVAAIREAVGRIESAVEARSKLGRKRVLLSWDFRDGKAAHRAYTALLRLRERRRWGAVLRPPEVRVRWMDET